MKHWRSLEELHGVPFLPPRAASVWAELNDPVSRREFLKLMAASAALAAAAGCTKMPAQAIIPYVDAPEEMIPGKPLFYASAFCLSGYARGILVETHEGRPTKIEGNPAHPASLGATDALMQAHVLSLYDPDRMQRVSRLGVPSTWDAWNAELATQIPLWQKSKGEGLRILTGTVTSPHLAQLMNELLATYPNARWHAYEPINRDVERQGALLAYGRDLQPVYRIAEARVIVSLDSDFLFGTPSSLRDARAFIDARRIRKGTPARMNRLHVAEAGVTITGAMADSRLPIPGSRIPTLALELARELGLAPGPRAELDPEQTRWLREAAADLRSNPGSGLLLAGAAQPPEVHAWAHFLNDRLGNSGKTLQTIGNLEIGPASQLQSVTDLAAAMKAGQVTSLLILGGNPVYDAPADLDFGEALARVPQSAHLSLHPNETSRLCRWQLPEAHGLESWGDARAFDGTVTMIQPVVAPFYEGRTAAETLSFLTGRPGARAYDLLRSYWLARPELRSGGGDAETAWRRALHDGLIAGTQSRPVSAAPRQPPEPLPSPTGALELRLTPDDAIWDGRFANNPWLQELPRQNTQLTWGNAALLSPRTAARLGIQNEDALELRLGGDSAVLPAFVLPGHADDSVSVALGYGRTSAGSIGSRVGTNVYPLRRARSLAYATGLEIRKLGKTLAIATTQRHFSMEGRDLVRSGTLEQLVRNPSSIVPPKKALPTLLSGFETSAPAWAMSIDLNACIGCNACILACQAENNIPVVGKDQVRKERVMHWIRVDRYYSGSPERPAIDFQPIPCMHCETAPCEEVCPTEATVHNLEGLNQMIYNRCVGTRYCSNNCPYKVRRFNFFHYTAQEMRGIRLARNPDVTVRSRGVMEKCTYCVQRINEARIQAELEDRAIRDGDVRTACQQACPTRAIIFGDRADPSSEVAQLQAEPLDYRLLDDLGTLPRTSYLARIRNLLPEDRHG